MKKPILKQAKVIKKDSKSQLENLTEFASPAFIAQLEKCDKEVGTANIAVNECFVIKHYISGEYHSFATDGCRSNLSVFRLAGGCNHLEAFDYLGCEKSEDYDSLPDNAILSLPNEFDMAVKIIEEKYIGRKLRVVARSADNMDQYGHRYYLFTVE